MVTRVNRWLDTLRWMLSVARCDILEPRPEHVALPRGGNDNLREAAQAMAAPPSAGWTRLLPEGLLDRPDVQRFRLDCDEVRASALVVDGWCILEKGARARAGEIPSIQEGLRNKRRQLLAAGVLRPVRGRNDVWVCADHVVVPSLANLARLLLGNNARPALWQRVA